MRKFFLGFLVFAIFINLVGCCLSHDYVEIDRKDAACDTDGSIIYMCSNCEEEQTEIIPAVGHALYEETVQEATCTDVGLKQKICSSCGYTEDIEIAISEHNYEYSVTKEPTLEAPGIEKGVCTTCGDVHERELMRLGLTRSNPGVVTVDELVRAIRSNNYDANEKKYNGKWVKITGKVLDADNVAGMTKFYLYGKEGSGLRIICWVDQELWKPFDYRGKTYTFIGQIREVTSVNATEIGNCWIVTDE